MWEREEIAPEEQFLFFSTIFSMDRSLISGVKLHIHLLNVVVRFMWCFSHICNPDISRYGYLEVFQRVPRTSRLRESTVFVFVEK